ncbi:hypothetical protein ACNO6Y_22310 [Vibrio owensii]|uniref:RelA/SpoT domain-containing protein n=1 Tax=Vibrio harveyi group TaxID=717610 RepID=UPI000CD336B0|nr:RelA/SpoT domain-containing protein [Vibrio campbellii]AUV88313.1 RelA/SpoT protein [Vibrio campbellii]
MKYPVEVVSEDIQNMIRETLDDMGIMFRIFGRVKSPASLNTKLLNDDSYGVSKKLQDLIGIRVVLYFPDDLIVVHKALSELFEEREKDQSIDDSNAVTFKPVRYNLVYEVPENLKYELPPDYKEKVDRTFELQLRTVLSEGWHEVEHDFRYKYKDDWASFPDEARMLNGVYASLVTNEWTMIKIFEEIAYSHYKSKNWEAMLRQKFRLRLTKDPLREELLIIFDSDIDLAKKFFRVDRTEIIRLINIRKFDLPISLNNLVLFANSQIIKSEKILDITPNTFLEDYSPDLL